MNWRLFIFCGGILMKKDSVNGTSMIGNREVDCTILIDEDKNSIHKTNSSFWDTKGGEVLGNTSLPFYGAFVSEEKCQLFGDVFFSSRCFFISHGKNFWIVVILNTVQADFR